MSNTESEQRQHARRTMHLPVTCCQLEQKAAATNELYLGNIIDVSIGGLCVQGKSEFDFTTGNRLLLLAMPQKSSESPAEIKGEVIWHDSVRHSFGLRFFL